MSFSSKPSPGGRTGKSDKLPVHALAMMPTAAIPMLVMGFAAPYPAISPMAPMRAVTHLASSIRPTMQAGDALLAFGNEDLESSLPASTITLGGAINIESVISVTTMGILSALAVAAARKPLMSGAAAYCAFAKASPYVCSISTSTIKGCVSDLFAQMVVERKRVPQWRRTLAFSLFGATYLGAFAQFKYATLYTALFGAAKTAPVIAFKLLADMLISAPLIYFPIYYLFKGAIFGSGCRTELSKYFSPHGFSMLRKYWVVWLPSLTVMWTLIPQHLRVAFLCLISLVWQVALSTLSYLPEKDSTSSSPGKAESDAQPPHTRHSHLDHVVMSQTGSSSNILDASSLRRDERRFFFGRRASPRC